MLNLRLSDREVRLCLEAVAQQAVRSPAIDAVVLFGSRARGDFRPDSDWDVALLARSDCEHPDVVATGKRIEAVDRNSEFEVWAQTTRYLRDYADRSNLLAGAVATHGVPLAGEWPLASAGQDGRQFMDLESMRKQQAKVCKFITSGWTDVSRESDEVAPDASTVSYLSGMAAELLARNIISSHSVQPEHSHDVYGLAEQLAALPLEDWESEGQRRHAVEALREMDGPAAKLHLGICDDGPAPSESMEKCRQRMLLTMELQVSWLSRCATRGEEWSQAAKDAGREIVKFVNQLRRMPTASERNLFDILPSQAVRASF